MHTDIASIQNDYRKAEDYLLAYESVIYLNTDLAIVYSAVQNFMTDYDRGFQNKLSDWAVRCDDFVTEAIENITSDGFNFYPGYGKGFWIHVQDPFISPICYPSVRSQKLLEYLIRLFNHDDQDLLSTSLMPNPTIHTSLNAVLELEFHLAAMERFEHN